MACGRYTSMVGKEINKEKAKVLEEVLFSSSKD
jgi:hypothetical protein